MKTTTAQGIRLIAILSLLGTSIGIGASSAAHMIGQFHGDWLGVFFSAFVSICVCVIPLAVAYFLFRQRYRAAYSILSGIAAIVVFGFLISLPDLLGLYGRLDPWLRVYPWTALIGLPLSLAFLFGPYFAAAWFFRISLRLYDRII